MIYIHFLGRASRYYEQPTALVVAAVSFKARKLPLTPLPPECDLCRFSHSEYGCNRDPVMNAQQSAFQPPQKQRHRLQMKLRLPTNDPGECEAAYS